jgi:hypothetical protein
MVLVIALVGIVASFGLVMNMGTLSKSSITQERDLFVTLALHNVRAAALANVNEISHGIYIDNGEHRYILFEGVTYSEDDVSNREIPFTSDIITITNSGGETIVFEQLSGAIVTGNGTVSVTNGNVTQEIILRAVGQIDW